MREQPDEHFAAGMADLLERARALLKPGPDQDVLIMAVDRGDMAKYQADGPELEQIEDARGNVVPLFGEPMLTGEEQRRAERAETAELLMELAEKAENGELRGCVVIAGIEHNADDIARVSTSVSMCVVDHMAPFLGGLDMAKMHIQDIYSEEAMAAMGEFDE